MKPKYDPAVHGDPPSLDEAMLAGMRPVCEVHGDEWVDRAMGRKRGRPRLEAPKVEVKIRLDANTVAHLRGSGPGWQTRVNAELGKLVAAGRI